MQQEPVTATTARINLNSCHKYATRSQIQYESCLVPRNSNSTARHGLNDGYRLPRPVLESTSYQALCIFFTNTVISSPGKTDQGHLAGLPGLIESCSRSDALPPALKAAALVSIAKRLTDRQLHLQAVSHYTLAIRRLQVSIFESRFRVEKNIATIVLLGIYETINAGATHSHRWVSHLLGLIALLRRLVEQDRLRINGLPTLLVGSQSCTDLNSCTRDSQSRFVIAEPQCLGYNIPHFDDLCIILPKVQDLFRRSSFLSEPRSLQFETVLRRLRDDAMALRSELGAWFAMQLNRNQRPTSLYFTQPFKLRFSGLEDLLIPALRADTYPDYTTACVWISYRQCQLHLTDLLSRINENLSNDRDIYRRSREYLKHREDARALVEDVCASIPFMLVGGDFEAIKPTGPIWTHMRPPMLIGGLSIQWVLFTISIVDLVSIDTRKHMKTILCWIGKHLGIGMSKVLAEMDQNLPGGITAQGDALRWGGFLV